MCGILGIYSKERSIDKEQIKKATNIMQHRGPDDSGFYFSDNIALGHRRLAVIDLSEKAKQPMCNETQNLWIVYNGELYNFQELKKELEKKGHEFKSKSDTEVVLHAYEEWREKCLEKFNGMFAFAIWDEKNKQLFLARDRAGEKPLYYYIDKEKFVFCSEIKALLELGIEKKLNSKLLYDYFNYFILAGDETLFQNIKTLPAAHYFLLKNNKITAKRYWDFDYDIKQEREEFFTEQLKNLLVDSIKMRMISDVPIGIFLSGGIDSSVIVALMKTQSENIKTFCIGSGDYTELKNAEFIAKHFNTEHHEMIITAEDFAENIEKMIWHYDMPLPWPSCVPLYFVSKLTKGKATVVLTGEGADELFAGYRRYYLMLKAQKINKILKFTGIANKAFLSVADKIFQDVRYKKNLELLFKGFNFDYATGTNILIGKERGDILNPEKIQKNSLLKEKIIEIFNKKQTEFLNKILYLDFNTYLVELLMKQDKMSMAASIESRVPFLDARIIELAASVPINLKLRGNEGKYILKKAMHDILPKEVIYQKKKGFPVPIDNWFRHELNGFIQDNLQNDSDALKFFDKKYVEKIIERQKTKNCSLQLWALLNFKIWHDKFFEK